MMDNKITYKRFDQVRILTTKNVRYLSAPPGTKLDPKGIWQVSGVVANELLLVKNNILIRIPPSDVLKIIEYDLDILTKNFGRFLENGERQSGQQE